MENESTEFIKKHEGLRLDPYRDTVGKWTIFYGRNISDVATAPDEILALLQRGKTQNVADLFFENDIKTAKSGCDIVFGYADFHSYSVNRQIALISIMFNLGINRFRKFKKMIQAVKSYRWDVAHDELLDSIRAKQIPARSKKEAEMLKRG